jgi:hypothetical protein
MISTRAKNGIINWLHDWAVIDFSERTLENVDWESVKKLELTWNFHRTPNVGYKTAKEIGKFLNTKGIYKHNRSEMG